MEVICTGYLTSAKSARRYGQTFLYRPFIFLVDHLSIAELAPCFLSMGKKVTVEVLRGDQKEKVPVMLEAKADET